MAEIYNANGRITIDASQALASFERVEEGAKNVDTSLINTGNSSHGFGSNLDDSSSRLSRFGDKAMSIGKKMSIGVTAPLVLAGRKAIKTGMDFGQAMSSVQAVAGASNSQMQDLRKKALEWGQSTSFSATKVAEAMGILGSRGEDANKIMEVTPNVLDSASASGESLETNAEAVAGAMEMFGIKAENSSHIADVFAKSAADSDLSVSSLNEALTYAGAPAHAAGQSLEEVSAALEIMSNNAINGSMAGTTLRDIFTRLAKPTAQASKMMQQYGFQAFDTQGKMLPLHQIITNLAKSTKGLTDQQKQAFITTVFGQESMSGLLAMMNAGGSKIDNMTNKLKNCNAAAKEMADITQNNTKTAWEKAMSAMQTAAITIQDDVAPMIYAVAKAITFLANAFSNMNPVIQKFILAILAISATIGPTLLIIAKFINALRTIKHGIDALKNIKNSINLINRFKTVISTSISKVKSFGSAVLNTSKNIAKLTVELVKNTANAIKNGAIWVANKVKLIAYKTAQVAVTVATKAMTVAQRLLNLALAANPIGLVITLLVSLATTFVILYNKCTWFRNGVNKVWAGIKRIFVGFVNFFRGSFTQNFTRTFAILGFPLNQFLYTTRAIFNMVRGVFNGFIEFFRGAFTGNWAEAFEGLRDIAVSIFRGIGDILKAPINAAISAINVAIRGIDSISFDVPSWIPVVGGQHFGANIAEIPTLYDGGIFTQPTLLGGSAIVGDKYKGKGNNPEAVIPLNILLDTFNKALNRPVIVKVNEREFVTMIAEKDKEIDMMKKQLGIA